MSARGTYHRNGNEEQHYRVLTHLQNGGDPSIAGIANGLHIHKATVRVAIQRLQLEGYIVTGQILQDFVVVLTDEGAEWKAPVMAQPEALQPCGHPVSRRWPNWGLPRLPQREPPEILQADTILADAAGTDEVMMIQLQPVDFDEACKFIAEHHRHHLPPQGWKFGIAVNDGSKIVGVITVGRPVASMLDDGWTLEVTRCCTDGTRNAPSMLYGAASRAAFALGFTMRGTKCGMRARVTIEPWTLQGAESSRFVIRHAWSATRIRGTTAATIAAGLSGTINSVVPLNGHFSPATATVYLPTVNHAIGNNLMVWAEIVYRDADSTSRWEIYQADCPS